MDAYSESNIINAIEQNLFDYLLKFGQVREGQIVHNHQVKATYTGTPLLNRVFDTSFNSVNDIDLAQRLQPFKDWEASVTWMTGPSTQPAGLGDLLLNHGFNHLSTWTGMALSVSDLPNVEMPEDFSIVEVRDSSALKHWTNIARPAFGLPETFQPQFDNLFSQLLIEPDAPFEGFLAMVGGHPVCTCFLFHQRDVTGIYWVATAESARHQGIATTLTFAALSRQPSTSLAVLHATPPGRGVYDKMGFKSYCEFDLYGWDASE